MKTTYDNDNEDRLIRLPSLVGYREGFDSDSDDISKWLRYDMASLIAQHVRARKLQGQQRRKMFGKHWK